MEQQNQQSQPPVFNPQGQAPQPAPQYQPHVTASPIMDPVTAVKTCFKKYIDFKGRARRSEFWWFVLFVFVVSTALSYVGLITPVVGYISSAVSLAVLIPWLAVLCRRLHDTNRGSWWVVLMAVLIVGYFGSFVSLIGANYEQLQSVSSGNVDEIMEIAQAMANSVQASPALATVMVVCVLGVMLLGLVLLIFSLLDSHWQENKYGPSPKYK